MATAQENMQNDASAQLELQKALNEELKSRLEVYQRQEEHLVPLPNGDLHRGFKKFGRADSNVEVEVIPESFGNPLDRAMAKILANKRIDQKNHVCLWCGLQFDGMGSETSIREHLKSDHASVVEGYDKVTSQVLMANLAEAQAELKKK